jgi:hypothetical protein
MTMALTDGRTSTLVVLSLYVLSYCPVCLLYLRRLGLFRLLYLLLHLPLLFLSRIFLCFLFARGQVTDRGKSGHKEEKDGEPSSHASPSGMVPQ